MRPFRCSPTGALPATDAKHRPLEEVDFTTGETDNKFTPLWRLARKEDKAERRARDRAAKEAAAELAATTSATGSSVEATATGSSVSFDTATTSSSSARRRRRRRHGDTLEDEEHHPEVVVQHGGRRWGRSLRLGSGMLGVAVGLLVFLAVVAVGCVRFVSWFLGFLVSWFLPRFLSWFLG